MLFEIIITIMSLLIMRTMSVAYRYPVWQLCAQGTDQCEKDLDDSEYNDDRCGVKTVGGRRW